MVRVDQVRVWNLRNFQNYFNFKLAIWFYRREGKQHEQYDSIIIIIIFKKKRENERKIV